MILYKKEPLPLQMRNMILLDDNSTGGVVYVSKATYDQALMLWSRFEGDVNALFAFYKVNETVWKSVDGLYEVMKKVKSEFPEPLNILAPFLKLLATNKGLDWANMENEMIYGILHQISQLIDFNATTLVPAEVAAKISIPTVLLKGYQQSWDDLTLTLKDRTVYQYPVMGTALAMKDFQKGLPTQPVQSNQPTVEGAPILTPEESRVLQQTNEEIAEEIKASEESTDYKGDDYDSLTEDEKKLRDLSATLNGDEVKPFDFTAFIDPDYKDKDGNVVGAVTTTSSSSSSDGNYAKEASALLDEFDELD